MTYLEWRRRQAAAADEGYGEGHINEPAPVDVTHLPPAAIAFLPLIVVFVVNLILGGFPGVFHGLIDKSYGANYDLKLAMDHVIADADRGDPRRLGGGRRVAGRHSDRLHLRLRQAAGNLRRRQQGGGRRRFAGRR